MSPTHDCTDKCRHTMAAADNASLQLTPCVTCIGLKARAERAERIVEVVKEKVWSTVSFEEIVHGIRHALKYPDNQ